MKSLYFREGMRYAILLFAIMAIVGCNFLQKETTSFTLISKENGLIELQTNKYQLTLDSMQIAIQTGKEAVALQFDNSNSVSPIVKNEEVYYEGIYPHTSLRFYEKGEGLAAYDFILQPGANANDICLSLEQNSASINQDGELILSLEEGIIKHSKPYSYQEVNGERVEVESNFLLADNCLSFELGDYDPAYAIVIDPTISFIMMAPSLLLDVNVSNTTPAGDETFQYVFRYRCASITENCLNANISFVVPDALEITSLPLQSGNIHAITETPVAGGTQVSIDLESPPSLNLGNGVLRAGSSGIFSLKVRFKCEDETTATPGSMINFVSGPTFTVSNDGGQMTTASVDAVTVPTLEACTPVPGSDPGEYRKNSVPQFQTVPEGRFQWQLSLTYTGNNIGDEIIIEDEIPQGALLHNYQRQGLGFDATQIEIDCGSGYQVISNVATYPNDPTRNSFGGILGDPGDIYNDGDPILAVDGTTPTGCIYRARIIDGTPTRIIEPMTGSNIRIRTTAELVDDTQPATRFDIAVYAADDLTQGDCLVNTATFTNATQSTAPNSQSDQICIVEKPLISNRVRIDGSEGFGTGQPADFDNTPEAPANVGGLYVDPNDLQFKINLDYNARENEVDATGGIYHSFLLPEGWDFVQGGSEPNYQYAAGQEALAGDPGCSNVVFTRTPDYNGTGRVFLEWILPDCFFTEDFYGPGPGINPTQRSSIYFSIRYIATAPLDIAANGNILFQDMIQHGFADNSEFHYTFNGAPCITRLTGFAQYPINTPSGAVNSEKFVKGSLDSEFSRFPQFGQTELTGEGEYEFFIYNDGFPAIERLDVVDILPHLGDMGLLDGSARESEWNAQLASAVSVERFKVGTGLIDATPSLASGVEYSTSVNPCYLDDTPANFGQVDYPNGTVGLMAGCDAFNSTTPAVGARSFAFQWQNAADPLLFGEYIKFTVDIQALTSDPQIANDEIAWNSFAFTAYQQGIGALLSTEPIKVGIQAFDPNTTAAIGNFVWEDANGNGLQDVGEPVFAGITVSLYDDTGNPVTETVNIGGVPTPVPVTTLTDANGEYCFAGLDPNTDYIVRLDNPANFGPGATLNGYILTTQDANTNSQDELDSDAVLANSVSDPNGNRPEINASSPAAGEEDKSFDFGFIKLSSVGNFVWNDLNSNGQQDAGEPGIENVTVTLRNQDGSIATDVNGANLTTTTSATGIYLFEDVLPGTYYVEFGTPPVGTFVPTFQSAGGDTNRDSDANADGETALFVVETCDVIRDIDAGFRTPPANPASIAGTVVDDINKTDGNAIVSGLDQPLQGIEVQLLDASQFLLESTTTDANGDYIFENLTPGVTYIIQFIPPTIGVDITFVSNGGDPATGLTTAITPAADENVMDVDAGLCGLLSIGNLVFNDPNNNGQLDAGETGISGVDVFLIAQSDGIEVNGVTYNTGDEIAMTTTDANGRYVFKFLPSGTYRVEVVAPGGDLQSSTDIASTPTPNQTDSDDNGVGTASTGRISSENITLDIANVGSAGDPNWTEADDAVFIMGMDDPTSNPKAYYTVDFGFFLFDPTPMCPFTCVEGNLLSWADPEWNAGRGWTTTGWVDGDSDNTPADPNNAITTPQIYTNFDGQGNTITATFSGNKPSGNTPGPNIYGATSTNDFGCNNALRMTGAFGTDDPANFPTETITFTNALEFNDFYVGGMRAGRSGTTERAEVSILTFSNGGTPIDPNSFTYTPLNAADVDYQIANNSIYVYGTSTNNDGLLAINLGGVLVDEIVWKVGEIEDNRVTVANFEYTGGQSSQWITPFCYDIAPPMPDCDCKDYVYLNEVGVGSNPANGAIHKFEVGTTAGVLQELFGGSNPANMNPWYPGDGISELPNPHGLGVDLNGYLYISETFAGSGDIRRFNCDGEITPNTTQDPVNGFQIDNPVGGIFNIQSFEGVLYSNGGGSGVSRIYRFDACTGLETGFVTLQASSDTEYDGDPETDWGFYINEETGTFYATTTAGQVFRFNPTDADFINNTVFPPFITPAATPADYGIGLSATPLVTAIAGHPNPGSLVPDMLHGITTDDAGNIFIVRGDRSRTGTNSQILKYDPNGILVEEGPIDTDDSNGGWNRMVGITYSSASDRLYTSTLAPNEDCVYSWNANDLTDNRSEVPPTGNPSAVGKGINILTECCPTRDLMLEETVCGTAGEKIFLQDVLNCGSGVVCEGQWSVETANVNQVFNECDLSITVNGSGCGTYVLEKTSNATGAQRCGSFRIELQVCTEVPEATVSVIPATCDGDTSNDDASLVLASVTLGDAYAFVAGDDFEAGGGDTDYANATSINVANLPIDIATGLSNPSGSQDYTVRVFDGASDCFSDVTVTLNETTCESFAYDFDCETDRQINVDVVGITDDSEYCIDIVNDLGLAAADIIEVQMLVFVEQSMQPTSIEFSNNGGTIATMTSPSNITAGGSYYLQTVTGDVTSTNYCVQPNSGFTLTDAASYQLIVISQGAGSLNPGGYSASFQGTYIYNGRFDPAMEDCSIFSLPIAEGSVSTKEIDYTLIFEDVDAGSTPLIEVNVYDTDPNVGTPTAIDTWTFDADNPPASPTVQAGEVLRLDRTINGVAQAVTELFFEVCSPESGGESLVLTSAFTDVSDACAQFDYGDLPDTYGTSGLNAPCHQIDENLKLGLCVDADDDGQPEAMAGLMNGGDDGDGDTDATGTCAENGADEDGITFTTPMIPGQQACIDVIAMNMTGSAATLQMWADWNGDGDFVDGAGGIDPGEAVTLSNSGMIPDNTDGSTPIEFCFTVPAATAFSQGNVFMRFRLSPDGGLAPDEQMAPVPTGEIEDHKLPLAKIGNIVFEDYNFNGIQDAGEPGIDGVTVTLTWGGADNDIATTGDNVEYEYVTGDDATLAAGEYYFCGLTGDAADPIAYKLTYETSTVPGTDVFTVTRDNVGTNDVIDSDGAVDMADLTMAMEEFTIGDVTALPTGENGLSDSGAAGVGTFPDAQVDETHDQGFVRLDYGDLPPNFPTEMADNGAVHTINPNLNLGATIDSEGDGQPEANAEGDGADEDGIEFVTPLIPGATACIEVDAINTTGSAAVLQGWIDWNGNDMLEAGEELTFSNGGTVADGGVTDAQYCFDVPADASFNEGMVFARFRLSENGGLGSDGPEKYPADPADAVDLPIGEVEDYKANVGKLGNLVFEDRNFNGQQDMGEPGIDGVEVQLIWAGPNGTIGDGDDVAYTALTTGSGTFDMGEYYYCGLIEGTYKLVYTTPALMTPTRPNALMADNVADSDGDITGMDLSMAMEEFTITDVTMLPTGESGTGDNGTAPTGTFPDENTDETHDQGFAFLDYGDLPDDPANDMDFPTSMAEGGAVHVIIPDLSLGATVDAEQDGAPSADATGDGADEDGITFATPLIPGYEACISVSAINGTGNDAILQGWIDWDGNNMLDVGEELTFTNGGLISGDITDELFCFDVPATAVFNAGMVFARFRLSPMGLEQASGPDKYDVTTTVPQGEVEDHKINVAKLGNLVWEDSDFDGTQDAGEAGLEGVTVNLEWTNPLGGTEMYTTTTDVNGNYYFCGLIPGTYEVTVVDPTDMTPSPSDSGNDDFDDSEYPGVTVVIGDPIDLPTGEDGLTDTPGGVDNFPDNQEDISIDFAFVGIDYGDLPDGFNTTEGNMGAAHLMQDGKYLGSCVDAELDGAPIFEATGDDDTASGFSKGMCNGDDDEDGVRILTPLVPGNISCIEVTSTLPAGGGFLNAWVDYNGNDAFEANEQIVFQTDGINGVLPAGTDEVTQLCFMVPADAVFEGLETHLRFRLSCDGNLGPDGLAPDGEVEDYYQPLAKLGDFVWEDVNGNGLQDAGEPGLGGLTVTLDVLDANGNPYQATTTTDANGMYMFFGLLPSLDVDGPYKLTFTSPGADWVATGQDSPINFGQMGDDNNDSDMDEAMFMVTNITLDPKENDPTIDAGFLVPAELGDLVWLDLMVNNQIEDGLQQLPPELPVEGAKLILTGTDGLGRTVMQMLVSDANGNYLFEDLWPGDYCVEMDVSMITAPVELAPFAAYLVFTYQDAGDDALDSDVNPGNYDSSVGKTGVYNLISQESELTVDGGILIPCLPPSNLDSDNIMLTTATLSWQVNNDPIMGTNVVEHCWNIEIGGAGFAVGNGQAIQAFTVCEGDAGVTITGDMVSIDVSNLIAGTCFDFYVSETCDGFFPGPNNVGWSAPHQFCTFDDPPVGSFTAMSPNCPEASPGFVPDGSFEVIVEDGQSCPGGTYDINIISGPYAVAPPSYLGVPAGTYVFFNAGPGMYEAEITEVGICNPKPDLMPVIVNVLVPDAIDMTPPTKFVADVLGTEVTNIGPFDLPEGSCSYQMQLYVSGIDDCDGVISALDAVSASAVTSPATVDPGTQVTVTPDGFGQYLLEVNFSVGTTILTINIADVSGNTTTMTYEVTVNDNINPSVSFTSNQNITIPACLEELEIPVSICIEDACDDAIDVAELTEDFGTATIVSGPTTTNGTCFDYILRVTVANDGDEFSVSYTDGFGNVGTASTTLTVEQAQENRPPVIIAANENVLLEVCDPQAMVYSFQIFDDCEEINTADINFDDGGSGLVITFVDVQGMSVFVEASGQVAAGSYELEIEYQGQTLSPVVEVIEQADSAPVITMPGNLNFTLPVCQDELTTTLSITIADDCDDPINEGALEVRLCGEIQTAVLLNTQNGGQAYAEYEVNLDAADDGCLLEAIYTDGAGNTTTQSAQISVTQQADNWAPLLIYPSQTIELELDACAEPLGQVCFEITATDNCDGEVAIDLSFSPSLPSGAIMVLPSSGGDTYCIAAEPGSYEVTITATDESGNVREEDFLINITQDARPAVNLACNNNLNITLDEDCQQEITADMLLEGNMGCLIDENFNIVIVDSDITNGNIADGCGEYIYEITLATPPATAGFTGDFAAANWMVVEDNSGFFGPGDADVSFTNETLSLSTLAGNTASASIVMPTDGDLSFDYTFNGVDVNFDFFIVDVAANEIVNTSLSTSGSFSESVSAGDVIVFTVDDDGFDPFAGPIASEAVVSNWSFAPSSDLDAGDFTTCWGNITLEDKTAPTIVCPEDTDQATVVDDVQLLNGELLITDNGLDISLYPCFLGLSNPPAGTHYYDLFTFTVNADDVYTFDMLSSWGDGAMALYQGDFNAASPCENMIAHSDDALSGTGAFFQAFDPIFRLSLPLQAGQTYTLLATSWPATQTGTYEIAAYSDGTGLLTGVAATQQTVMRDLVCTDWEELLIEDGMYLTDGDGNILTIDPALAEKLSYTGLPEVGDNCGDLKVSIHDSVAENGDCGEVVITRTFTVADKQNSDCAGTPNVEVCTQTISIRKPTTADVVLPPFTVYLECDEGFATDDNGNPHPSVSGYPFVQTAFGLVDLDQSVCNLAANYSDEPGVSTCESGNETRREWTLYNWCDPGSTLIYNQIIKVSDFTAPVVECPFVDYNWDGIGDLITYSTDPFDCTASFQVPLPTVTDNCSSTEVFTQIVTDVEVDVTNQYGQVIGTDIETIVVVSIANDAPRAVANIPVGNHRFRYVVEDDCGNETVLECDFRVVDQIEPVAICDDDLNISIGGQNYARVYAEDIDEGSYDNCGDVTVEVRRQLPNGQFTPWGPHVDFDCVDVNTMVTIELRATDENGLQNVCWLEVLVEDKTRPECIAPHNVDIGCDEVPYDFDPFNTAQLQDLFGEAMATDNCDNATWEELTPIVQLHDCGFGRIIRRFRATDAFGNVSTNSCQQIVTINEVHDYEIKFPRDAEANCGTPSPDTIEYNEIACDLLAVSTEDEFFSASGDECYKIFRTFRVINWCEYDGEADPIVVRRDEDCDGNPGDENVWVLVRSNEVTYYDRDNNEGNTNPFAFTKSPSCDGLTNPTGYWKDSNQDPAISSVGYWQYTQVIKVYDNIKPVITFDATDPFCSIDNVNCDAVVDVPFSVDENCTPDDLTIKVFLDAFADGVIDADLTGTGVLSGTYPDYNIGGEYPIGSHAFEVHVEDGCGNVNSVIIPFSVVDCKAPTPICISGLAIELMPVEDGVDADGDGDVDTGAMAIWASDFIASPVTDCSEPIKYSINRAGDTPVQDQTGITLTCDDDPTTFIEIYAWDSAFNPYAVQPDGTIGGPNYDFCETFVLVQDNMFDLCDTGQGGIAGYIETEENQAIEGVDVNLSGDMNQFEITGSEGTYTLYGLTANGDYTITPLKDTDHKNGVSTFDIVVIMRHILNVQLLDSPYKMIAADVDNSGSISISDLIAIRKLVLSVTDEFENNTSWRFVDAAYNFPEPTNPWLEEFPEIVNINDLEANSIFEGDFVGVKIGDVTGDVQPNSLLQVDDRTNGVLTIQAADQELQSGQEYEVVFTAAELSTIAGYQWTMRFDEQRLELVDVMYANAKAEHFYLGYTDQGLITSSVDLPQGQTKGEELFRLKFRAKANVRLSEALSLNSRLTKVEAYRLDGEKLDVALAFGESQQESGYALYQNVPNPFQAETTIAFELPQAMSATIKVQDITGRTLRIIRGDFAKGYNEIRLTEAQLEVAQSASAVLMYTLETADFTATRKMILLD